MGLRALLVGLIVAATALFVVGVAIEHGSADAAHHAPGEGESSHESDESGAHAGESANESELRPLGVDDEAWPFVIVAALASLALAATAWLRPQSSGFMTVVAGGMFVFAVLDIREVLHQLDVDEIGLAVLAGVVAGLHLAASAVAVLLASRARPNAGGALAGAS
jgi:hypothetical protein